MQSFGMSLPWFETEDGKAVAAFRNGDRHGAVRLGKLDRIVQQIDPHLLEQLFIDVDEMLTELHVHAEILRRPFFPPAAKRRRGSARTD